MAIDISQLPLKYQQQALKKYEEQQARRRSTTVGEVRTAKETGQKYHNIPTERLSADGTVIRFPSRKEARRFDELLVRLQTGQIQDLRLQVDFTLQEAYTDANGHRIRAIRYKADFTYLERDEKGNTWKRIAEDAKGKRTKEYVMKKKMMKDRLGIDIIEV